MGSNVVLAFVLLLICLSNADAPNKFPKLASLETRQKTQVPKKKLPSFYLENNIQFGSQNKAFVAQKPEPFNPEAEEPFYPEAEESLYAEGEEPLYPEAEEPFYPEDEEHFNPEVEEPFYPAAEGDSDECSEPSLRMLEDILADLVETREECHILQDASYSKLTEEKFIEIQEQKCLCLQDLPAVLPVFSCAIHLEKFVFNPAFEKAACGILNKGNSPSYDFEDFPQDFEEFPEMENFEDFPEKEDGPVRDEEPAMKQTGKKLVKGRESRLISKEQRFNGESSKVVGNRGDRRQLWEDTDYSEYDQFMTNLLSGSILDLPMGNPPELLNGFDDMHLLGGFPDMNMNELFPDISGYWDNSYWGRRRMSTDDDNEEVSGETTENDEEGSGKRRALDYFGSNGMCSGWLVVHRSQYHFWKRYILPRFRNCYLQRRSDRNYVLKRRWRRMLTATDENEEDTDSGTGSGARRGLSQQHWIARTCRGIMFAWIEHGVRPTPSMQRYCSRYAAPGWISGWRRRMSTSETNEENTDSMISTTEEDGQNTDSDIEAGSGRRKLWYQSYIRCQRFGGYRVALHACNNGDTWACGLCGLSGYSSFSYFG